MQAIALDSVARLATIGCIDAYQTYLSPRKGFSCAHRMLNSGESCSEYVKRTFSTNHFMQAVQISRERFRDCAAANQTLKGTKADFRCIILPCCFPL